MLARREPPPIKVFAAVKPALAGTSPAGGAPATGSDRGAAALSGIANLSRRGKTSAPNTSAPPQTASYRRGDRVAVPSFVLRAARAFRGHPAIGYVAAVASIGLATALQWAARDLYEGAPFLTIYPAVVLTTFVGGYRAGLLSVLLAGLSQWYLFIPEPNSFAIITFVFDAVLCVALIEYINRSLEHETEAKAHQAFLRDEMHHRMHNLFTVVQSVIRFSLPNNNAPVFPRVIEERLLDRLQAMFDANRYVSDATGNVALLGRSAVKSAASAVASRSTAGYFCCSTRK